MEIPHFSRQPLEMLLKAVGHCWALLYGHSKAPGKYLKAIGKPLGNS
jgi:hypothetical protein